MSSVDFFIFLFMNLCRISMPWVYRLFIPYVNMSVSISKSKNQIQSHSFPQADIGYEDIQRQDVRCSVAKALPHPLRHISIASEIHI